jgi:hypothetical protein
MRHLCCSCLLWPALILLANEGIHSSCEYITIVSLGKNCKLKCHSNNGMAHTYVIYVLVTNKQIFFSWKSLCIHLDFVLGPEIQHFFHVKLTSFII